MRRFARALDQCWCRPASSRSGTIRVLNKERNVHGRCWLNREHFVLMDLLAKRLRERARQLELPDAEVARRAGLAERRYGHYVRGKREPDFATLIRICAVLDVTPNDLLLADTPSHRSTHERWLSRLIAASRKLDTNDMKLAVRQIEALVEHQKSQRAR